MGYYKTGIASVNSIQNAILEIMGDLTREREGKRKAVGDEKPFEMRIHFQDVLIEPYIEATFNLKPIVLVCIATCVYCNRSYETRPRSRTEATRKVLCVQCRRDYERS